MMAPRTDLFSWRLFDDVAWWAVGLAAAAAVVGGVVTHGWAFPLTCLAVCGVDVAIVHVAARRGGTALDDGELDTGAFILFGGRLVFKALVLVAALLVPSVVSFWGAVVGAVAYDTMLAVAGSVISATRVATARR